MLKKFKIGNFTINEKSKAFIIAEIGVNHNGSFKLAKKSIEEAKKSGANCVKFQTFKAETLSRKNASKAPYQIKNTKNKDSQFKMLKNLELEKNFIQLWICKKLKLILSTILQFQLIN